MLKLHNFFLSLSQRQFAKFEERWADMEPVILKLLRLDPLEYK